MFLALATGALLVACGDDPVPPATERPTPIIVSPTDASVGETALAPSEAENTSVLMGFPRHFEPELVNHGKNYVYGKLSRTDDCLRISYTDQAARDRTRDGLMVVWPAGFDVQATGDAVVVLGPDQQVVAAVGQTLRVSGRSVPDNLAAVDEWDWSGGDPGHCAGPFWLVGDEVTAMTANAVDAESHEDIYFPRLGHQRGPLVSTAAGIEGRLALRGRCLLLEVPYPPGEYLVVWPPGFGVQQIDGDLFVLNGGGSVIVRVGDDAMLSGNGGPEGKAYSDECGSDYFKAYSVASRMP